MKRPSRPGQPLPERGRPRPGALCASLGDRARDTSESQETAAMCFSIGAI